jgi:hypothetical protein
MILAGERAAWDDNNSMPAIRAMPKAWSAMLTAAPAREPEGGAVFDAAKRLGEDLDEGRIKDFAVSRDVAVILAALTPKEAPAATGAGERLLKPTGSKPTRCCCPPDRCDAPVIMGRQAPCLRVQPQAREEAQPVGHFQFSKTWNAWEEVSPEYAGSDGIVPLYTTPPTQPLAERADAEKLRGVVETLEALTKTPGVDAFDRGARAARLDALDMIRPLAAPQQEGR